MERCLRQAVSMVSPAVWAASASRLSYVTNEVELGADAESRCQVDSVQGSVRSPVLTVWTRELPNAGVQVHQLDQVEDWVESVGRLLGRGVQAPAMIRSSARTELGPPVSPPVRRASRATPVSRPRRGRVSRLRPSQR